MVIAIVGATGMVGREILKILNEKDMLKNNTILLYASKKSHNKKIRLGEYKYVVKELNVNNLLGRYDYALFSAGKKISNVWANEFVSRGAVVIDNSSCFRRKENVPLVVPEINGEMALNAKIIANPNCSTIGLSIPLYTISKLYNIKRIIASTYQAVSGAGNMGVVDLNKKTCKKFIYPIYNNIIPQIDDFLDNGYTFEEDKMEFELRKILKNNLLPISATCVRVPIKNCHSESVFVELDEEPNIEKVKNVLRLQNGIQVLDDTKNNKYPMPLVCNQKNDVFVGRLRKDTSCKNGISFFISFDNIRKGASLNAVQIMEFLINKD